MWEGLKLLAPCDLVISWLPCGPPFDRESVETDHRTSTGPVVRKTNSESQNQANARLSLPNFDNAFWGCSAASFIGPTTSPKLFLSPVENGVSSYHVRHLVLGAPPLNSRKRFAYANALSSGILLYFMAKPEGSNSEAEPWFGCFWKLYSWFRSSLRFWHSWSELRSGNSPRLQTLGEVALV